MMVALRSPIIAFLLTVSFLIGSSVGQEDCALGSYWDGDRLQCARCSVNHYKDWVGPDPCTECPYSKISPSGSKSRFSCADPDSAFSDVEVSLDGSSSLRLNSVTFEPTTDSWLIDLVHHQSDRDEVSFLYLSKDGGAPSEVDEDTFLVHNFPCDGSATGDVQTVCCLQNVLDKYHVSAKFGDFASSLDLNPVNGVCNSPTSSTLIARAPRDEDSVTIGNVATLSYRSEIGDPANLKRIEVRIPEQNVYAMSRAGSTVTEREIFIGIAGFAATGTRILDSSVGQVPVLLSKTAYGAISTFGATIIQTAVVRFIVGLPIPEHVFDTLMDKFYSGVAQASAVRPEDVTIKLTKKREARSQNRRLLLERPEAEGIRVTVEIAATDHAEAYRIRDSGNITVESLNAAFANVTSEDPVSSRRLLQQSNEALVVDEMPMSPVVSQVYNPTDYRHQLYTNFLTYVKVRAHTILDEDDPTLDPAYYVAVTMIYNEFMVPNVGGLVPDETVMLGNDRYPVCYEHDIDPTNLPDYFVDRNSQSCGPGLDTVADICQGNLQITDVDGNIGKLFIPVNKTTAEAGNVKIEFLVTLLQDDVPKYLMMNLVVSWEENRFVTWCPVSTEENVDLSFFVNASLYQGTTTSALSELRLIDDLSGGTSPARKFSEGLLTLVLDLKEEPGTEIYIEDLVTIHLTPAFSKDVNQLKEEYLDGFTWSLNPATGIASIVIPPELEADCPQALTPITGGPFPTKLQGCATRRDIAGRAAAEQSAYEVGSGGAGDFMQLALRNENSQIAFGMGDAMENVLEAELSLGSQYRKAWWILPGYNWQGLRFADEIFFMSSEFIMYVLYVVDTPGLRRRALTSGSSGIDAGGRPAAVKADIKFDISLATFTAEALGVQEDLISSWEVGMAIRPEEACRSGSELTELMENRFKAAATQASTNVEEVVVGKVRVCRESMGGYDSRTCRGGNDCAVGDGGTQNDDAVLFMDMVLVFSSPAKDDVRDQLWETVPGIILLQQTAGPISDSDAILTPMSESIGTSTSPGPDSGEVQNVTGTGPDQLSVVDILLVCGLALGLVLLFVIVYKVWLARQAKKQLPGPIGSHEFVASIVMPKCGGSEGASEPSLRLRKFSFGTIETTSSGGSLLPLGKHDGVPVEAPINGVVIEVPDQANQKDTNAENLASSV